MREVTSTVVSRVCAGESCSTPIPDAVLALYLRMQADLDVPDVAGLKRIGVDHYVWESSDHPGVRVTVDKDTGVEYSPWAWMLALPDGTVTHKDGYDLAGDALSDGMIELRKSLE